MRLALVIAAICLAATPSAGQSLRDRIVGGIQDGAAAVNEGASSVADAVEGSITSTRELFKGDQNPNETRAMLDATADRSLARLFAEQPQANALYERAVGYAVFDMRKVTLAGFSGGGGRGVAVHRESGRRVYMNMTTAGVGLALGIGGFESQMVMLFEDETSFNRFVTQGYDASANAGSMVGDEKSEIGIEFEDGRATFVLTTKGWRVAASATGSTFWPDDDLN